MEHRGETHNFMNVPILRPRSNIGCPPPPWYSTVDLHLQKGVFNTNTQIVVSGDVHKMTFWISP
jgi:hypothetical protein